MRMADWETWFIDGNEFFLFGWLQDDKMISKNNEDEGFVVTQENWWSWMEEDAQPIWLHGSRLAERNVGCKIVHNLVERSLKMMQPISGSAYC